MTNIPCRSTAETMDTLPTYDLVLSALAQGWGVVRGSVHPCVNTRRLFEIDDLGFARVSFPRDPLSAVQVVELLSYLHDTGCAVPGVVETRDGALAVEVDRVAIAIETRLTGEECSAETLEALPLAGQELARIHLAMSSFPTAPMSTGPLGPWVDGVLGRTMDRADDVLPILLDLQSAVSELAARLVVPWGLTHGDVRGANVLYDGRTLGFTDLNPKVLPLLRDVVMIRNKWLTNGAAGDRPLTSAEVASFVRGYSQVRSLSEAERASFPVVWAVYQADRLLRDRMTLRRADSARRQRWPVEEQIRSLPDELDYGRHLLDLTAVSSD